MGVEGMRLWKGAYKISGCKCGGSGWHYNVCTLGWPIFSGSFEDCVSYLKWMGW
jgi:hypothetical protein